MKTKLLVLFGGRSGEYEVSLISASAVLRNIDAEKYDIIRVGISRDGKWYLFGGDISEIESGRWCDNAGNRPCAVCPDYGSNALIVFGVKTERLKYDVVFPIIHGTQGEDGTVQGLFELAGARVVGCRAETSALCMDKAMTKTVLRAAGIVTAKDVTVLRREWNSPEAKRELIAHIERNLPYPVFVKPSRAGSSVGVSKAHGRDELCAAFDAAFEWDDKVLCEEYIEGREIECAVFTAPDGAVTVSEPGEIDPGSDFYDYDTKYKNDNASYYIPARLDSAVTERVRECARLAASALGITGLSRIDFFVADGGETVLNEVNTMPGFTPISMYPKLMIHGGMTYSGLIDGLISEALERV